MFNLEECYVKHAVSTLHTYAGAILVLTLPPLQRNPADGSNYVKIRMVILMQAADNVEQVYFYSNAYMNALL